MPSKLIQRLSKFVALTDDDREALTAHAHRIHHLGPREDLAKQGEEPSYMNLVLEGWACRYKQIEDGRRQIIALFAPGDMCDPMIFLISRMSHALGSLTPVTVARFTREEMETLTSEHPNLGKAFWFDTLIAAEIQREWTVSLGCRTAAQRMAHLFCELPLRLKSVGLSDGSECDLPMTQSDLADALGLSTVHINRTLQELRGTGFVDVKNRRLMIRNERGLREFAFFDPGYLHL